MKPRSPARPTAQLLLPERRQQRPLPASGLPIGRFRARAHVPVGLGLAVLPGDLSSSLKTEEGGERRLTKVDAFVIAVLMANRGS